MEAPFVPNRSSSTLDESLTPLPLVVSSTKRRHHPSSAPPQSFRQPPLPVKLASGETLFRILCPSNKTGGVIGKGGTIIRQLREETGAKIRIDDAIPGCEERVILIIADSTKKDGSSSSTVETAKQKAEDSVEDTTNISEELTNLEDEESPAQQTLLMIFERILKVKDDRSSSGESKSDHHENGEGAGGTPVVCRLLAPNSQIGSVLGKGGKIIEKIRHESGAQVRVLPKDLIPHCASHGDELIQIAGKLSAVRKAVLSVSGCLQDCSRGDAPTSTTIKSICSGIGIHGTGSENSGRMVFAEEVVFKLLCQVEKVGSLIGKGGSVIRVLQNETHATIKIADASSSPDSDERVVVISARENLEQRHSPSQDAVIRVHSRIAEIGFEPGSAVVARLLVHSQHIGYLFGKGGTLLPELRRVTGASISVFFPEEHFPKYGSHNDEIVQVIGSLQSVQDALFQITSRLREIILFPVNPNQYVAPPYQEMPPPPPIFRPRHDPASPGYQPSPAGFSRGGDHDSSRGYLERVVPYPYPYPYPHGSERAAAAAGGHAPPFDRQSSPGRWTSQIGAGGGRVSDVGGFSMSNGPAGSGGQAPFVGSTSIEVVIPQIFLSYIYGENNSNLVQIRRISGANVVVNDPRAGATEGVVVVSGTPDQIHAAQSLIHAFILCERDNI